MHKRLAYVAIALLFCGAIHTAVRAEQSQEVSTFASRTELMQVHAVVTDAKGRIVENLTKEDFELLENEKPQEISFFSSSQAPPMGGVGADHGRKREIRAATKTPEEGTSGSLDPLVGAPPVRTVLLYVDNLHLSDASLYSVKTALRSFINEKLTDQDMISLATSGGSLGIAQQFTNNREVLNYAIEQIQMGHIKSAADYLNPILAAEALREYDGLRGLAAGPRRLGDTGQGMDQVIKVGALRLAADIMRRETGVNCPCAHLRTLVHNRAAQVLAEASFARRNTLVVLRDFARQMADLPGKRMIVVFSEGFTMLDSRGSLKGAGDEEFQSVVSRAARAGVTIYTINAKGLQVSDLVSAARGSGATQAVLMDECDSDKRDPYYFACWSPDAGMLQYYMGSSEKEQQHGLHTIAEQTGGKLYNGGNDLSAALGEVFDANRVSYVLSYYLSNRDDLGRFRNIKVRVRNHPEYKVRSPRGFLPADLTSKRDETASLTPQQRLIEAMAAPFPTTHLGISAQTGFVETESDDKQVSLAVYIDGDRFQYREEEKQNVVILEILYVILDSSGKQVDAISAQVEGRLTADGLAKAKHKGYRFVQRLSLKPGAYQVRVGVRDDATDRMGTATAWIEVPELQNDRLQLSSLVFRNPAESETVVAEGIKVNELEQVRMVQGVPLYARGDFCDYSFRVRRGAPSSGLALMREVWRNGKPVQEGEWQPVSEEHDVDAKGWFDLDGDLDLSGMEPGIYELRISVKDAGGKQIAKRSAVFGLE